MVKKAIITIHLVEESDERTNAEIEKDISDELSAEPKIPWFKTVEKVKVTKED